MSLISKIFEKVLCQQIEDFSNKTSSSSKPCGFRKEQSTQNAPPNVVKNWHKCLDKSEAVGTVLMYLNKAYDCLPHDLLLGKLSA